MGSRMDPVPLHAPATLSYSGGDEVDGTGRRRRYATRRLRGLANALLVSVRCLGVVPSSDGRYSIPGKVEPIVGPDICARHASCGAGVTPRLGAVHLNVRQIQTP